LICAPALAALLRRDRAIVFTALIAVAVLAWSEVLHLANAMAGVDMYASGMMSPVFGQWTGGHFTTMLAMWMVMMVGMMTPSVAPMILLYVQVARRNAAAQPFASALWFTGGYFMAWAGFSLLATAAQWSLEQLALLSPMMSSTSHVFGGLLLISAGVYQWLPIKHSCLARCRAPLSFVMAHGGFQAAAAGSVRLGLQHGLYCIGCCWALMALLFAGGIMNLLWIAALMVLALLEKLLPWSQYFVRASGLAAIGLGAWYLAGS
jgi:predicted metal-binding membrane protein